MGDPYSVGRSAVSITSFTPTGMPCSRERGRAAVALPRFRQRAVRIQVSPRLHVGLARANPLEACRHQRFGFELARGDRRCGFGR